MKRNNPLKDELEEEIENDVKPDVNFDTCITEIMQNSQNRIYGDLSSNGKILILEKTPDIEKTYKFNRMYINPSAGKLNIPIHMVNINGDGKKYDFNSDWASTYPYNMFIYKIKKEYYVVCHRHGGSGCKTIFCSVCNKVLKKHGIKMEMNWIPPTTDDSSNNYNIEKITLICKEKPSPDEADELNKNTKRLPIKKELTLNLNAGFGTINTILGKYQIKEISKDLALSQIKTEINDEEYNSASLVIKIGKVKKKIAWDDFEGLIEGFDITDKVANTGNNFLKKLKECCDDFITQLLGE